MSNDLSKNLHIGAYDLIENKDIVEAKIEVDECSEDKEVEMVRRKTRNSCLLIFKNIYVFPSWS